MRCMSLQDLSLVPITLIRWVALGFQDKAEKHKTASRRRLAVLFRFASAWDMVFLIH